MSSRVLSGIPGLDEKIGGGLLPGSIIVLAGGIGSGKTSFALRMFSGFKGKGACFSSDETPEEIRSGLQLIEKRQKINRINILSAYSSKEILKLTASALESGCKRLLFNTVTSGKAGVRINSREMIRLAALLKKFKATGLIVYLTSNELCRPDKPLPIDYIFERADSIFFLNRAPEPEKISIFAAKMRNSVFNSTPSFYLLYKAGLASSGSLMEEKKALSSFKEVNALLTFYDLGIEKMILDKFSKNSEGVAFRITESVFSKQNYPFAFCSTFLTTVVILIGTKSFPLRTNNFFSKQTGILTLEDCPQ